MDVIITFANDSIYGQNTTNTVFGEYSLSGRNIHITSYGGTKIAQPQWGNMFSDVVYRLESFAINEHQLRLYYNDKEKSVTLTRV
jgi:heat shock protein HslJ